MKNTKILKLTAENLLRLKAVEITPDGELVVVGGRNAQGKTSVLDAIEMALGGKRKIPPSSHPHPHPHYGRRGG